MKAVGAFSVKSYNQQRRDARQMIIKAGRELQMLVVPEGGSLVYHEQDDGAGRPHRRRALAARAARVQDIVTLFATSGAGYTPTLIVGLRRADGENYWYQHHDVWANKRLLTFTPRDVSIRVAPPPDGRGGRLQPRPHRAGRQGDS